MSTDNSGGYNPYSTPSTAHADPDYTRVTAFDAVADVRYYSGGTYNVNYTGRTAALQVQADILPARRDERTNIIINDFGTTAQQNEWSYTGTSTSFVPVTTLDKDGDDLANRWKVDSGASSGTRTATLRIDAPNGYRFANPIATGTGYGSASSWATSARLYLSLDGTSFDVISSVPGSVNGSYTMTADSTGTLGYDQDLETVWLRIGLSQNNGATTYAPWVQNIMLTGLITVPEPASLTLVGLGGFMLMRRRRT
ncbi:MAG: PEP-CTERM sorting domain-containing protein [Candidatus Pacebacteria bacterium]|nr:PEP-CTERM sorting domain-containing protein [Candidatus Paceibacterota bacterium]